MLLPPEQAALFHTLYPAILRYAVEQKGSNGQKNQLLKSLKRPAHLKAVREARDLLFSNPKLIGSFVRENPDNLIGEHLSIISAWKKFKKNEFIIERDLKKHTIFLEVGQSSAVYGVLSLYSEIHEMTGGERLPLMVETVLLPWLGKIIHDGVLVGSSLSFGPNMGRSFKKAYREAKKKGITTTLQ